MAMFHSFFFCYFRLGVELGASQARQRNLETWHERCDDLHGWVTDRYTRLRSRPTSPEASFGGIKRQQSVIEVKISRTWRLIFPDLMSVFEDEPTKKYFYPS